MAQIKTVNVSSDDAYRSTINQYSAKGFTTIRETNSSITLSRKSPFNWVIAIICLFIPIIGWIALIFMIMASFKGSQVVEVVRTT